jgi:hypothetical protein
MILGILGVVKILEVIKAGAITMARMNGPGKDEDDILLERMLEEVTEDSEDDDEPEGFEDIEQELGI